MHPLQKQFHDYINNQQLLFKEQKVLLAISGGMDSMVMAEMFLNSGYDFAIAHCNFGLRGKESDADEALVREWAKERDVVCHVKQIPIKEGSIQLEARNARYKWFDELMKKHDFSKVATGHHLNDSLETTLINLSRGTGIKGIAGIQSSTFNRIRPLLFATRNQIKEYALEAGVSWREDASNAKKDYNRNFIRHDLIPRLEEINPAVVDTFRNTNERLQLANEIVQAHVDQIKKEFISTENNSWKLETEWISEKSDLLILSEIVSDFGFNYVTAKEIFDAIDKSGKEFYSEKYWLSIDRSSIYIQLRKFSEGENVMVSGVGEWQVGDKKIILSNVPKSEFEMNSDSSTIFLDMSKIDFPLTVRKWKEGDRFKPLGMKGSKKVSDFLIDKKVPVALKNETMVMISQTQIIWLIGHQISDEYRMDKKTKELMKIQIK